MKRSLVLLGAMLSGALTLAGCGGGGSTPPASVQPQTTLATSAGRMLTLDEGLALGVFKHACDVPADDRAGCHAILRTDSGVGRSAQGKSGGNATSGTPAGYGPAQLQAAYGLTSAAASGGTGRTVAIVDAYDDPNLEADLGVYRSEYGLPPCTTANGCFRKVSQTGTTSYPTANGGWGQEESLDVDMVSANCPNCHILVVEANSTSFADLSAAVNEAAALGANAISNSYGGNESSGESAYAAAYNHAGIAITASAGDSGYGAQSPAAYNTLTAVGGTTLSAASNARGYSETVWSGSGSGCSAYIAKPSWQHDTGCARRTIADVAYEADPNTGVAVYDSFAYNGTSGWLVFGGTSVASPAIAAIYELVGNSVSNASGIYAGVASLYDVTSGTNGRCGRSAPYLCHGEVGYDGPTGNGTPHGTGAF